MKTLSLLVLACCLTINGFSQLRAVTENGDQVVLFSNGSWEYEGEVAKDDVYIETNKKKFKKPENGSFLLKSSNVDLGFWLDPKVWTFKKSADTEDTEYQMQLKGEDLYAMILTEKVEIPLENLKDIAYENGKAVAPDLKIVQLEYRMVNDLKVLFMQMNGTTQGIKFSYYGYYYSFEGGTVQYITYTSQNLLNEYQMQCEDLLNGLVSLK